MKKILIGTFVVLFLYGCGNDVQPVSTVKSVKVVNLYEGSTDGTIFSQYHVALSKGGDTVNLTTSSNIYKVLVKGKVLTRAVYDQQNQLVSVQFEEFGNTRDVEMQQDH